MPQGGKGRKKVTLDVSSFRCFTHCGVSWVSSQQGVVIRADMANKEVAISLTDKESS